MTLPNPKSNLHPQSSYSPNSKNNGVEGILVMVTNYYTKEEGTVRVQLHQMTDALRILSSHYKIVLEKENNLIEFHEVKR